MKKELYLRFIRVKIEHLNKELNKLKLSERNHHSHIAELQKKLRAAKKDAYSRGWADALQMRGEKNEETLQKLPNISGIKQ
jgi:hypothetical protein